MSQMQFPVKKVILVTGANGQLGKEFRAIASQQDTFEFLFTSRASLDITDKSEVLRIFKKFRPDFCINCAAYTAVDKAEEASDAAYLINSTAVSYLANACHIYNCKLIHFSTDYVYDSITDRPIIESDPCTPRSVYGQSKRAGEIVLSNSSAVWVCLRVSWLYSSHNTNFVKTMMKLGNGRDELKIVNDQHGSPTYARDLAIDVMSFITGERKITFNQFYNYSNNGSTTWAAFASEIFTLAHINCRVQGITSKEFGAAAPRPLWSILSKAKITQETGIHIRDWKESLARCIIKLS